MRNVCDSIDSHAYRDCSDGDRGVVVRVERVLVVRATLADAALKSRIEITVKVKVVGAGNLVTWCDSRIVVIFAPVTGAIYSSVVCVLTFLSVTSTASATHVRSIEVNVIPGILAPSRVAVVR